MPISAGTISIQASNATNWTTIGTIGNYFNVGTGAGTSITLTNNNATWADDWVWNTTYTSASFEITYNDAWAFKQTAAYNYIKFDERSWYNWNEKYELTVAEKRERLMQRVVQAARSTARHHGSKFEDYLFTIRRDGEKFNDDELRLIEDAFQRGSEERVEDERQRAQARLAAEERARLAAEANRRAEMLLRSLLTHEQKQEWMSHRRVTEVAPSGRVWRLFPLWSGSATIMDGETRRATLCVHPRERVPDVDNVAALLMALRSGDEDHLIQIAILHGGHWTAEEEAIRRGRRVQREHGLGGGYIEVPVVA